MVGVTQPDPTLEETVSVPDSLNAPGGAIPADPTRPASYQSMPVTTRLVEQG